MVITPAITNTPRTVAPRTSLVDNKEAFSLAMDTLKRLSLCHHAINEKGAPIVSGDLNFDRRIERKNDVGQYFAHLYATNKSLRDSLSRDTVKNVNNILKTLSTYSPLFLMKQPFTYTYSLGEIKNSVVLTLVFEEPLAALSLITASGCGFNSGDEDVRKGALNFLIVMGKSAAYSISTSNNVNQNTTENLSTLFVVRKILHQMKDKNTGNKIFEIISKIDNEFEALEEQQLKYITKLSHQRNERVTFS